MARITLENIDSIRSADYDSAVVRFAANHWDEVSDRVARRTISWLRSEAVVTSPALQIILLDLDEKAIRYMDDLSRPAQRFVINTLEDVDLAAMVSKAHGYSVIVPELWDAIISQLEAGTLSKRELAAYEQRDRLPRAFKQALAASNVASVTKIGSSARGRRAAKIDYLKAFEEATTVVQIRNAAELLLKACKSNDVESTSSTRRALRNVINADSAREVRAARKEALAKFHTADEPAARQTRKPKLTEQESDLMESFLTATRSAKMQENAQALLSGARRAGVKLTSAQRRALKLIAGSASASEIRATFKAAVAELTPSEVSKPAKSGNRSSDVDAKSHRRPKIVTQSESDADKIPEVDLVAAWLNARRTADMKETSAQLLSGARRAHITMSTEVRKRLKDVQASESRSDIRAAYHDAVNAYQNGTAKERSAKNAQPSTKGTYDDSAKYGRLARTITTDGSEYDIPDDDDQDDRTHRRRAVSDSVRVSRRRVGANRHRDTDTDFSDAARVTASVRRVRRPQDYV